MMLIPRKRNFDLLDDIFADPFLNFNESKLMKTDIKEHDDNYEILVDLPGYDKENIKMSIEDGYLTISAKTDTDKEEKKGTFVRKERYYGECSRNFYVGENIESEDIKANYKNGTLTITIPKKEETKEEKEKKYIEIGD